MEDINNIFELSRICKIIKTNKFKRVVLQFPDETLKFSVDVYEYMMDSLNDGDVDDAGVDVFISADSTYGSSVDDVSADHVDAEIMVSKDAFSCQLGSFFSFIFLMSFKVESMSMPSLMPAPL